MTNRRDFLRGAGALAALGGVMPGTIIPARALPDAKPEREPHLLVHGLRWTAAGGLVMLITNESDEEQPLVMRSIWSLSPHHEDLEGIEVDPEKKIVVDYRGVFSL